MSRSLSETESFQNGLVKGLSALDIAVDGQAVMALGRYHAELKRWGGKMNLIAKNTPDEQILENHFLDSLTLLPLLPDGSHLLDIGTGAGFPGLVCKAAFPSLRLTLVEPRQKRVSFLRHIVRTLELQGVDIVAGRIEDDLLLPSDTPFTHITSRAVSDIAGFLAMAGRFFQPGLQLICMKGPKWQEELAEAAPLLERMSLIRNSIVEKRLPLSGKLRVLVVLAVAKAS
jgi:16S rRNA (guanine527-N7)-methyltransferase